MKNTIFTIATFLLFAAAAFGQETVTPKAAVESPQQPGINVRVGQKFSVVTETKNSSTSEVMGQVLEDVMSGNSTVIYEVVAVEPDSITLKATISSLRFAVGTLGQDHTFDSSRNDNSGVLAELLEPEMKRVRTVTISRSGQITKEDEPWKTGGGNSQEDGLFKAGRIELFEPELTLPELKAGTVVPSAVNPQKKGSYTVGPLNGGTANVSYAGTGQSSNVLEQIGLEMKVQSTWTERSDLKIDAATRVVLSRETTKDITLVVNAGGMDIPSKGKVTISQKTTRLN